VSKCGRHKKRKDSYSSFSFFPYRPRTQKEEKYSLDHDVDGPVLVRDVPGPFPIPTRRRVVANL